MANKQIKQLDETLTTSGSDLFIVQKNSSDITNKVKAENMIPNNTVTPDKLNSSGGSTWAWIDYTPELLGSTTNPTLGNGTIKGRYTIIGKTVKGNVWFRGGSTTTMGSGNIFVRLPIAVSTNTFWDSVSGSGASHYIGGGFLRNIGTESWFVSVNYAVEYVDYVAFSAFNATDSGTTLTNAAPFTIGSNDSLRFNFEYEID